MNSFANFVKKIQYSPVVYFLVGTLVSYLIWTLLPAEIQLFTVESYEQLRNYLTGYLTSYIETWDTPLNRFAVEKWSNDVCDTIYQQQDYLNNIMWEIMKKLNYLTDHTMWNKWFDVIWQSYYKHVENEMYQNFNFDGPPQHTLL